MTKSEQLFDEARRFIPGGVNSPVRAFGSVGGTPVFVDHARGAYIFGADGTRYVDYVGSWGPMILGHAHPAVIEAVKTAADRGLSYGAPTAVEPPETSLAASSRRRLEVHLLHHPTPAMDSWTRNPPLRCPATRPKPGTPLWIMLRREKCFVFPKRDGVDLS